MRTPHAFLALAILTAGLLVIGAPRLLAGRNEGPRMEPIREARSAPAVKTAGQTDKALRLTGTLRYDGRRGLQLDRQGLQLTAQTVVFPREEGRRLDPRRLHGQKVTVFGTPGPRGLRVSMLLLEGERDWSFQAPERVKPSAVDARVGEFEDEAG